MKTFITLFIFFMLQILPSKGDRYLWEVLIETDPAMIADGIVTRGSKKTLILKSEQNGVTEIIQKFINVNVTNMGKIYFSNRAFEITSGQLISDINKHENTGIENIYIRSGSHEKLNIITVPIEEISGKVKPLVITRKLIAGFDIYVLEAVLDHDQVRNYKFPVNGVSESAGINRLETENERVLQRKPSQ